jgi:hypothetical protein
MRRITLVLLVSIIFFVCLFNGLALLNSYLDPFSQPMPSIWLHKVEIENETNNLLITLCSNVYNNLEVSKVTVTDRFNSTNVLISSTNISINTTDGAGAYDFLVSIPIPKITPDNNAHYKMIIETNKGQHTLYFGPIPYYRGYIL